MKPSTSSLPPSETPRFWKVVRHINKLTGELTQHYFYKRLRAWRVPLTSHLARQFAGYGLLERDLRTLKAWIAELDKVVPPPRDNKQYGWSEAKTPGDVHFALFVAAITFYGRCFNSSGTRRARLDESWLPEELRETHRDFLRMRNKFAAHSDDVEYETVNVVLVFAEKNGVLKDRYYLFRELKQLETISWPPDEQRTLRNLVEILHTKVLEKLSELQSKLFAEEINPPGFKHWLSKRAL